MRLHISSSGSFQPNVEFVKHTHMRRQHLLKIEEGKRISIVGSTTKSSWKPVLSEGGRRMEFQDFSVSADGAITERPSDETRRKKACIDSEIINSFLQMLLLPGNRVAKKLRESGVFEFAAAKLTLDFESVMELFDSAKN